MKGSLEEERKFTEDEYLGKALLRLRENYFSKRRRVESLFDIDSLKIKLREIKRKNIEVIEGNLIAFVEKIKGNVDDVFLARDEDEALRTVESILQKEKIGGIIKSKSLTTEEIGLNDYLVKRGYKVIETDLGEWLVQINKEKPTHMTAPAIHMSKERINRLLKDVFKVDLPMDTRIMVDFCKDKIREGFKEAGCGIVGANVASLESGNFFILSNEGNIQNVLRKRVVICVLGVDKIVERDEEAFVLVDILPKVATGQITTSYVDVFKRPFGKFYVVLIDNGRLEIKRNKKFRDILYCVHCGACQNACPVYTTVSGKLFKGKTYAGPVGVMLSYLVKDTPDMWEFANMCIGCLACDEICSARIPIQHLILEIKSIYKPYKFGLKQFIIKYLENNYSLLRLGAYFSHFIFKRELKTGIDRWDRVLGVHFRPLPGIKPSFDVSIKSERSGICLFAGCSVNFFYPGIGLDALAVAGKLGVSVSVIEQKSCCGAPAWYNGEMRSAEDAAKNNIEYLLGLGCERILFLDPHCAHMVKRDYAQFCADDRAEELSKKVTCAGAYFLDLIEKSGLKTGEMGAFLGYHHPCHLKRGIGDSDKLESFLRLNEPNFVEISDKDRCCGFAGSYSIVHPYISKSLLEEKIKSIKDASLQVLVTACPGCIMQIAGGLKAKGEFVEVLHFVSYLNRIL